MLKYSCIHKVGDKMNETKVYDAKEIESAAISSVIKEVAFAKVVFIQTSLTAHHKNAK